MSQLKKAALRRRERGGEGEKSRVHFGGFHRGGTVQHIFDPKLLEMGRETGAEARQVGQAPGF